MSQENKKYKCDDCGFASSDYQLFLGADGEECRRCGSENVITRPETATETDKETVTPHIVHFEYPRPCPRCKCGWSGMYEIGKESYLCPECYKSEEAGKISYSKCERCSGIGKIPDNQQAGAVMRNMRLKYEVGVRELARQLGCVPSLITMLETGERNWNAQKMNNYLEAIVKVTKIKL